MFARTKMFFVILIVLLVPVTLSSKGSVYLDSTVIDVGVGYTLVTPSPEALDQSWGADLPEIRNVWALWPVVGIRMPIYQIGTSMLKLNLGIQPMFYIVHKMSQLNTYDTTYTDTDFSAYAIAEYSFPVKEGMDFTVGAGFKYHLWTYDYYYDSQITTDTSDSYVGSFLSLSFMLALDYMIGKNPLRIALMPDLSYDGVLIPISISFGFPLGSSSEAAQ